MKGRRNKIVTFDSKGRIIVPKGLGNEIVFEKDKSVSVSIRGEECYLFNNEDYPLFKDKFDEKGQAYINQSKYLLRKIGRFEEPFHRWLVAEDILNFCKINNCKPSEVEVHHINFNQKDNRKENLQIMFVKDHEFLHKEDRAWTKYRKRMSEFWRYNKDEDYYRRIFNYKFKLGSRVR